MPALELNPAFEQMPVIETIPAPERNPAPTPISAPEPIPKSEIPPPEPLPESGANGAFQPTQDSENVLGRTDATTKKTEYALSWAFPRKRLSAYKENFWIVIGLLVLICSIKYCHFICVSYRKDETTQESSPTRMLLHQWESAMIESRGTLERKQKLEKLHAHFQNGLDRLKTTVKAEDEIFTHNQLLSGSMKKMEVEDEHNAHCHRELGSVTTVEEEDEHNAHCHRELDSVTTMEEEDEHNAHCHRELDSVTTMEEEDERNPYIQNEGESPRKMKEDERPAYLQNGVDYVKNFKMRAEERRLRLQEIMDMKSAIMEKDEEEEDEDDAHTHNDLSLVKTIKMEDKYLAHFQNERDSVMIETGSFPLNVTEETAGYQAYMESPVKLGSRRENSVVASKATSDREKKVPMNKMGLGLASPPNPKATRSKVVSQSNPCHRPGERPVKISNKNMDYTKIKAKVDTWRNAKLQSEGDSKADDRFKAPDNHLAEMGPNCDSVTQSRQNEHYPDSKLHASPIEVIKRRVVRGPAELSIEDDCGTARILSENRSGRAAFRREQREELKSNHPENRVAGNEGGTDRRRHNNSYR
jgi:hypothetical protein